MQKGIWCAAGAYVAWGLFPLYWKALQAVPALEVIGHRVLWSCFALAAVVLVSRSSDSLRRSVRSVRVAGIYLVAALLVSNNWLVFIWAVNTGQLIESSLGYFINPLVSVLLGVIVFRERLRPGQWLAVALAAIGVLYLVLVHGAVPWIALSLATSFSL